MELFELIGILFNADKSKYSKVKSIDKSRNAFMVNRFFSIKYPTSANRLNRSGMPSTVVVDMWQLVSRNFTKTPFWIYTKTKKSKSANKNWKPDPELAKMWMDRNNVGLRELNDAIRFNPDAMQDLFKRWEKFKD